MSELTFSIDRIRQRRGLKWHEYDDDVIPAWVAEMDYPPAGEITEALRRVVDFDEFGYPPRGIAGPVAQLQKTFSARMDERFGWRAPESQVRLVADLEQAMIANILAFAPAGGGVAIQSPVYPPFQQCVVNAGRVPIQSPLIVSDGEYSIDFANLEHCMRQASVLLFCNPQNPTGRVFSRAELEQISWLSRKHDVIIVSDEIHADIVYDGFRHIPIASLDEETARRTITITSATKSFNIPGLRCGIMHFGSDELHQRFRQVIPDQLLGHPNIMGVRATLAAWQSGHSWLQLALHKLAQNRERLRTAFSDELAPLTGTVPQGTFMSWIDAGSLPTKDEPASQWLLARARVAMNDGAAFGPGGAGHIRLNFATSQPVLESIIERLAAAIKEFV